MTRRRLPLLAIALATILAAAGLGRLAGAAQPQQAASDPELLEAGRELYVENCQPCHGDEGKGDGPAARFLDTRPRDLTAGDWMFSDPEEVESIREVVASGVDGTDMEPFDEILDDGEIDAIVAYVFANLVPRD